MFLSPDDSGVFNTKQHWDNDVFMLDINIIIHGPSKNIGVHRFTSSQP